MRTLKTNIGLSIVCFLILSIKGSFAVANTLSNSTQFTNEQQLHLRLKNEIKTLWQQGIFEHFTGVKNTRINYAAFIKNTTESEKRQCIVIVPGRSEGYLKYQELTFDLYQQGYDIFIIDHRGQGISQRLLSNGYKGYVDSFEDYSDDLHLFIDQVVTKHCSTKPYLLAHSMGGLISARYLQKYPETIKAAVLSSPMIAINAGGIPKWLAKTLIYSGEQFNQWFSDDTWYFLGQDDVNEDSYQIENFDKNPLMQSQLRYQEFTSVYHSTPEIQLGGVTVHWLAEALEAEKVVFDNIKQLSTPILVLQASADTVVDNDAQNEFCQQLHKYQPKSCPNGKAVVIEGARHELFFESDNYRNQALQQTMTWFKTH